ncbi:MAG: phospholipase D-like domain-containing protein [Leptolyngbyaceae cyanobacterium MO_188.B28]|nr:phospholipase D-like domain-containing protein [Leptolyngbyaceae cyanobacterium MO_188.B28]
MLGFLMFLGFTRWRSRSTVNPSLQPLPQDPYIQVYFNHSEANIYIEPYRGTQRLGDNLEQVMIETINQAQTSIDLAAYELGLPKLARALRDRHRAGVQIRIILDNQHNRAWSEVSPSDVGALQGSERNKYEEFRHLADQDRNGQLSSAEMAEADALHILKKAQIPILDDTADGSKGSGIMHHKFIVVDNRHLMTGSANYTTSGVHGDGLAPDSRGNANALLKIESPALANLFTQEFELMWGDGPAGRKNSLFGLQKPYRPTRQITTPGSVIDIQFSPTSRKLPWSESVNGAIARTLSSAVQSIDLALFVFSDQMISNQLAQKAETGLSVKALIDPSFVYRNYSEGLDMLGLAIPDHRCQYESGNQPWEQPILSVGTPELPAGDKLHHKFALIDDRTVIIGSHNWSNAANEKNDENLLVIQNPTVAAHFRREFDRLYRSANLGITPKLQKKVHQQQQKCNR